jgi:isopenicillin-N N-acyltransferase-like protein
MHEMEPLVLDQEDPGERGEAHGESWREEIRELAEIRTNLALGRGAAKDEDELIVRAGANLRVLEALDRALHGELGGIARGADLDPERVVVVNAHLEVGDIGSVTDAHAGGSTTVYAHGDDGPILAQTCDIHGTAQPFVRMIRVKPPTRECEVLCLTLTGCLGMAGMNDRGVGVVTSDLWTTSTQVGLLWPAVVRRALAQPNARAARALLMATDLSGGRHYMIAEDGHFVGIETAGPAKAIAQTGARATHVHTNHFYDPELLQHERLEPGSASHRRLDLANRLVEKYQPTTMKGIWEMLAGVKKRRRGLCVQGDEAKPERARTCGLIAMDLRGRNVLVARGCGRERPRESLHLGRHR